MVYRWNVAIDIAVRKCLDSMPNLMMSRLEKPTHRDGKRTCK